MTGHFAANGAQGVGDARHQGAFGAILLRQLILQPCAAAGKIGALLLAAVEQGAGIAQRDFTGGAFQQRRGAHAGGQRGFVAKVGQRVDAKQRVGLAVELQRRLQGVPVTGHRLVDQRQPVGVARQPAQLGPGAGEIQHDAQVFGARQQRGREAFDLHPIRRFFRDDGAAELLFGLAGGGLFHCQKVGVVFQVVAAGIVRVDRCQQGIGVDSHKISFNERC